MVAVGNALEVAVADIEPGRRVRLQSAEGKVGTVLD